MKKYWLWGGVVVLTVVIAWSVLARNNGVDSGNSRVEGATEHRNSLPEMFNQPSREEVTAADPALALIDDDAILGDPKAPVTLVEFGDFQCTFCTKFFKETEGPLIEKYVRTGKVKLVFRDFVVNGSESQAAAEAAQCAGEQKKYWDYHDKLYTERRGYNKGTFRRDNLIRFAKELELDETGFTSCFDSERYKAEIAKDTQDAQLIGGRGTPTFILGNQLIPGAQPLSFFEQAIDQLLN